MDKVFDVSFAKRSDGLYEIVDIKGKRLNDLPFMYIADNHPKVFLNETQSNNCLVLKVGTEFFYLKDGDTVTLGNAILLVKTIEECNIKIHEMEQVINSTILDPYVVSFLNVEE